MPMRTFIARSALCFHSAPDLVCRDWWCFLGRQLYRITLQDGIHRCGNVMQPTEKHDLTVQKVRFDIPSAA